MPLRGSATRAARTRSSGPVIAFLEVFAVLSLACIVFLWKPIFSGGWYAAADVSGLSPIVRADGADAARLPQIDVVVDFLPWIQYTSDELRAGHLATWNPYNSSGVPHLANIQTATFSPFNLPFHVFSMRVALIVSVYLVLMTAGLLSYGLMRHLGTSRLAGIVTALAYMYCGFMTLWLRWPLAAVAAFLPGLVWASGAFVRAGDWRQMVRRGCAVMILVALALFAGHPETLFFGLIPAVGWAAAALLARRAGPLDFVRRFALLAVAGLAGLGLAAVQVLPFTQYFLQSPAYVGRNVQVFQSFRWLGAHAFPLAHGSPAMEYAGPYSFRLEFHEVAIMYVGIFALFLAAIGVVSPWWTKRRTPLYFAGLASGIFVFLYDVVGIGGLLSRLPVVTLLKSSRTAIVWAMCIAVLAGFGVDALRSIAALGARRSRLVLGAVSVLTLGGVVVLTYRVWHIYEHGFFSSSRQRDLAWRTLTDHVGFVWISLVIGVMLALSYALIGHARVRTAAAIGIVLVVFLQSAFLLRGQNPTVTHDRFMNFSPRVSRIAEHIGHNQTIWLDGARLMPDVNLWFPTYSPDNYDVIDLDRYQRLYRAMLNPPESIVIAGVELGLLTGPYEPSDIRALQTLGIRRVVTGHGYPMITSDHLGVPADPVSADGTGRYRYRWGPNAPSELIVYTEGIVTGGFVDVTVSGDGLDGPIHRSVEIHGSLGVIELPDDLPASGVLSAVLSLPSDQIPKHSKGRIVRSTIVTSPLRGLELDASVDGYQIFRVPGPSGFVFSPPSARVVTDDRAAVAGVLDRAFDPTDEVVIENSDGSTIPEATDPEPGRVRIMTTTPTEVTATVTRSAPGYAVFMQNDYPGWHATVDGKEVPIERANTTFMAVEVPRGTSSVTFRFESSSIKMGAIISIVFAVGALGAFGASRTRRRRTS